ncbi:hypothetical protein BDP27DRAFT_350104 [Rhodocollybia butyracea]|uniref:F-box domain-containing protein n=1 Tax=Rhodocollybia butyracea TaxID=206335 RepID=A0A9P5QCI6_9AGAR|nr:hypothetical protein BDP27DRAFT_350104 [Rhodocollybia butyracea]
MEKSFTQLLTSNNPADEHQIPDIRAAILDAQRQLFSLDQRLAELELIDNVVDADGWDTATVLQIRDEELARVLRLQSVLSPFRRLPPEILAVIFSFALPGEKGVPMDANSPFWRFSQVCRVWRNVVCEGMQQIWSSIEIDCMKVERTNLTSTLLELALQRSGTRSLSIRFCFSARNRMDVLSQKEEKCWNLLTNESFRWKELELNHIPIVVLGSLSAAVKSRMPLLRRLVIENVPMSHTLDTPSTAEAFEIAPQLEHFTLSGYFRPSRFQLPWSQLTSYSGSFRDIRDFLIVLACANNLVTCDVFLRNYNAGFIVDHPNIRTLRMRGAMEGLSRLRLPFLQTLLLDELIIQDLSIISAFLRRTPSVSSLEVHIPHEIRGGDLMGVLMDFLSACRLISSLALMGEVDVMSVCSLLNVSEARLLIPRLRDLSLSIWSTTNEELLESLGAMIESRCHRAGWGEDVVCVPLASLTLQGLRVPDVMLQRLKPLEEVLGLKVTVKA